MFLDRNKEIEALRLRHKAMQSKASLLVSQKAQLESDIAVCACCHYYHHHPLKVILFGV